ncbi:hypothetical protein LTR66_003512 [Elasticomyces elasticus]|nr:hypothetical protein LTR66_003512 [Elasticomyces elasticus]KAK5002906.1 hypothetical protein LTR28_010842 [Elasticomyces elasticus]
MAESNNNLTRPANSAAALPDWLQAVVSSDSSFQELRDATEKASERERALKAEIEHLKEEMEGLKSAARVSSLLKIHYRKRLNDEVASKSQLRTNSSAAERQLPEQSHFDNTFIDAAKAVVQYGTGMTGHDFGSMGLALATLRETLLKIDGKATAAAAGEGEEAPVTTKETSGLSQTALSVSVKTSKKSNTTKGTASSAKKAKLKKLIRKMLLKAVESAVKRKHDGQAKSGTRKKLKLAPSISHAAEVTKEAQVSTQH